MPPTIACPRCGAELPNEARHCPTCGQPTSGAAPSGLGKATVMGIALPEGFGAMGPSTPPWSNATGAPAASERGPVSAGDAPVSAARVVPISGAGPVEARVVPGTMIGVRVDALGAGPSPRGSAPPLDDKKRTMLGVALPGIAPTHEFPVESRRAPSFVPPPPPPSPSPIAAPSHAAAPTGVVPLPVGTVTRGRPVALAIVVFVAVCAAAAAIVWMRSAPPPRLVVERRATAAGDALFVVCKACPDRDSSIRIAGNQGTFAGGSASVALPAGALHVGKNALPATIALGRGTWSLTLDLLVPFAAHAGLDRLGTDGVVELTVDVAPEVVAAHVEDRTAKPKNQRIVLPVPLSPTRVDAERSIAREVAFTVDLADGTHRDGSLTIALPVVDVKLAAPRVGAAGAAKPTILALGGKATVGGKTAPHAKVTLGATSATADDAGLFRLEPDLGDATTLPLLVTAPGLAPRALDVAVLRAASVDGALGELRTRVTTPTEKVVLDPDAHAGEWLVGVVDVAQARDEDGRTIVAGDLRCGGGDPTARCSAVRVLLPPGITAAGGDVLRIGGVVVRAVPIDQGKKKAPEVEALAAIAGK